MVNKKINDLPAAGSIGDTMQLETDTGGATPNKVTSLQMKNYVATGIAGGRTIEGGTQSNDSLVLQSTSHGIKGPVTLPNGNILKSTTPNYETFVTTDNVFPNKKYVDDAIATENLWDRSGTDLLPHNAGDSVDLQTGGLKDTNVTTAVDLGDASNVSYNTNNKTIIGQSNEILTNLLSAGYQSGGALTDNLDGTVDIALGTGYIRQSDSDTATLQYATWATASAVALTDEQSNYIYVDYNAGTPIIAVTLSGSTITENENDKFELYEVVREGTDLHVTDHRQFSNNVMRRTQQRFYDEAPIKRTSGLIISETGTRNITVSAGVIWTKLVKTDISAIDTSAADTFDRYYRATPSGWTKQSAETQWDNLNYDDDSGTLAALGINKWANQFFYMEADGALVSLYGQASFNTEAGAEGESRPGSTPPRIEDHAVYIGRCIFQQNAATATFKTAFEDTSGISTVQEHNELGNLGYDVAGHGAGFSGFQRGTTNDTSPPTINDDDSSGYRPGDLWVDTSADITYFCVDASTGAAIWQMIMQNHYSLGNLTFNNAGHGVGFLGFQRGTTNLIAPPTVTDDSNAGYRPGDFWVDTAADTSYICIDASIGAAIWHVIESGLSDIWTRTGTDVTLTHSGDTIQFDSTGGVQFGAGGQNIIEFSTDVTLAGDSDTAIPTEKATKTYVDNAIGGEDIWDRTGTTITVKNVGDDLDLGTAGHVIYSVDSVQVLSPTITIPSDFSVVPISSSSNIILTSIPQIVAGTNGQTITIIGASASYTQTLVEGNGLKLDNGQNFTMGQNDTISFVFYNSLWIETSRVATI